nr:MAG TPA: DNA-directed RNA polymerase [Caudoviricetes sp.]
MTREEAVEILMTAREMYPGKSVIRDAFTLALFALRPVSREQVEKVWRGVWKHYLPPLGAGNIQCRCTKCGRTPDVETPFCAWCGAPMTDEAVEMVMERWEALKDGKGD